MKHKKNPYTKNGKTLLFTCQDKRSLDILEKTGLFLNKRIYIEEHLAGISSLMLKCYDWFIKESSKRIKKPDYADYHIWCSVSAKSCMRPEEGDVAYILEVPDEEILYFSLSDSSLSVRLVVVASNFGNKLIYRNTC